MKKSIPFFFVFLLSSLLVQAQEEHHDIRMPISQVKIFPQAFFINTFQLGIETFNESYSSSFTFDLGLRTKNLNFYSGYGGVYGEIGYRKYFVPMKLVVKSPTRKYYLGTYYSIDFKAGRYTADTYDDISYDYKETSLWSFSPSFTIGIQKTIWQVLQLDMFVGGSFGIPVYPEGADKVSYPSIFEPAYKGIYPKIGVKIGVGLL